jgi:hypothetical protein
MFCERGLHKQAQIAWKVFPASEKFASEKACMSRGEGETAELPGRFRSSDFTQN